MRYVHLYFTCLKRSIVSRLEYKKDTFVALFSFFLKHTASILSIYFIINQIPSLNGWTIEQLGFLYGFSMMPVAIDHLFTDDLWNVAYSKVRNGELDKCFLRPVPILFQVMAESFQPEGFGELIVGIVMLGVCGTMINVTWSARLIILLIVATIFGAVIITSLKIIFASFAFVFKRSGPILQIVYNFIDYTRYPITIYPKFIQIFLTFIFPFALVISIPIQTLLFDTISPFLLSILIIVVSLVILLIAIKIWNFFEKRYESSGS